MADDDGKTIKPVIALFNADGDAYSFRLPPPTLDYRLLIDSDDPDRSDLHVVDGTVEVAGHSLMLLTGRADVAALAPGHALAANQTPISDDPPAPDNAHSSQAKHHRPARR